MLCMVTVLSTRSTNNNYINENSKHHSARTGLILIEILHTHTHTHTKKKITAFAEF